MSLTGKTITELPPLSGYQPNVSIPVEFSGQTYQVGPEQFNASKVWSALLTQTGPITYTGGTDLPYGGFIFNETYTINTYSPGDDFSNIAEVISGTINTSGCVFRATGTTTSDYLIPTNWVDSVLTSDGNMVVNVLENTLGYNVLVDYPGFGIDGLVGFFPDNVSGGFLTQNTKITAQSTIPYGFTPVIPFLLTSIDAELLSGIMYVLDPSIPGLATNLLYNTPVEIRVYNY
jgi:hypothetical protein